MALSLHPSGNFCFAPRHKGHAFLTHNADRHGDPSSINKSNDKTAAIKHDRNAGEPERERCIEGKVRGSCAQRRDKITFVEAKPSGNGTTA